MNQEYNGNIKELQYYNKHKMTKEEKLTTWNDYPMHNNPYHGRNVRTINNLNDYYIKCLYFKDVYTSEINNILQSFLYKDVINIIIGFLEPDHYKDVMKKYLTK